MLSTPQVNSLSVALGATLIHVPSSSAYPPLGHPLFHLPLFRRIIRKRALADTHPIPNVITDMEIDEQDAFDIKFFENALKRDPKNPEILELLGSLYSKYDMARQTLRIDRRLTRINPKDPRTHYNLACSLSLLGRKREAVETLSHAIDLGYNDMPWLLQDPDLLTLNNHPGFQELIAEHKCPF